MSAEIKYIEPAEIVAGDTVSWYKSITDYPASDGWVLSYRVINLSNKYDISTSASGDDHLALATAAETAAYSPGEYSLVGWVEKGSERHSIPSQKIKIQPDLASVTSGYDCRSTSKKILDLLDAALLDYGSQAWVQSYDISGRRMAFKSQAEFMALRSRMQLEVNREENSNRLKRGLKPRNKINVRL